MVEPRQGALDYPPCPPQPGAVGIVLGSGQQRHNAPPPSRLDIFVPTVSSVALKCTGTKARPAYSLVDRWYGIQQRDGDAPVGHVRRSVQQRQRNALSIGDQMPFAAILCPIRGVGAGVSPPKTARTLALSMTARDKSIRPSRPRALRTVFQIAGQRPASVHSRNRRQQVLPSPQPSSAGRSFQMQPVRSTKMMPTKQQRSGMRGRPPLGLGGSGGRRGWICSQSSSLNHCRAIGLSSMTVPMVQRSSDWPLIL